MTSLLDEITSRLTSLPEAQRKAVEADALKATAGMKWLPNPGPQTNAYLSQADVLLYGGSGGSGKSDLGLGLAFTAHRRTLILRRQYANLTALMDRAVEINGSRSGFAASPTPILRTSDSRHIQFGAAQHLGDEQAHQGQPFDLKVFDEVVHFLELQVRFHLGWLRTSVAGQRTRAVFATNPPVTSDGDWIIPMFAPWLDVTHAKPAKPGELRWYVSDPDGKDFEVDGPELYQFPGQTEPVTPKSRTFIPGRLADNPYITQSYKAELDGLPEPIRSAVRDGNFMAARPDAERQVIPTSWVMAAVGRWTARPPAGTTMTSIAADVAQGGADQTVISSRYGGWFSPLVCVDGKDTETPSKVAALVAAHRRDGAVAIIDLGGGYGGGVLQRLQENEMTAVGFKGAGSARGVTKDASKTRFINRRAESWWRFREALDPDQEHGSQIAIPNDPQLIADLTAPTYDLKPNGYQIEDKDQIKKRLGRSPDKGDAVTMCFSEGQHQIERGVVAAQRFFAAGSQPTVRVGYAGSKRYGGR